MEIIRGPGNRYCSRCDGPTYNDPNTLTFTGFADVCGQPGKQERVTFALCRGCQQSSGRRGFFRKEDALINRTPRLG